MQLETVYMVEGLGPPSGGTHPHPASFAAAVSRQRCPWRPALWPCLWS